MGGCEGGYAERSRAGSERGAGAAAAWGSDNGCARPKPVAFAMYGLTVSVPPRPEPDTPVRIKSTPSAHPALSDLRCFESGFFAGFQKCSCRYDNSDGKKRIDQAP
jgi:hypothetical protein